MLTAHHTAPIVATTLGEVTPGDFLVDLDNGYIVEASTDEEGFTEILFHDADGEEATLSARNNLPIRVKRY